MFMILLPLWTGWALAALVALVWLWGWALCRAAARGDDMICSLRQDLARPHGVRHPGDVASELLFISPRADEVPESVTVGFGVDEVDINSKFLDDERPGQHELPPAWATNDAPSTRDYVWSASAADVMATGGLRSN